MFLTGSNPVLRSEGPVDGAGKGRRELLFKNLAETKKEQQVPKTENMSTWLKHAI